MDKTKTHGDFSDVAALAQKLKNDVGDGDGIKLNAASLEAISQIFTRIARIVYGDENHRKHWEDIIGFCQERLGPTPKPDKTIEDDIHRLVRSLPTVRMEKANGTP
jgi:hypothetical protein